MATSVAWLIAVAWVLGVLAAWHGVSSIPDLLEPKHDENPPGMPSLTVVVPARNEERSVRACLESLLAQDYPNLAIVAIDDRSTDGTVAVMASLASPRLQTLRISDLPDGWLGKTHAMATAARELRSDFVLFTDADILFRQDALRRALAHAVRTEADHLVVLPTTLTEGWGEAAFLSFLGTFGLIAGRPWRVSKPGSREAIGIGAFNLLRGTAYRAAGGFEALRMEVIEDVALGRRIKAVGLRQRVAFGRGLVSVRWAAGLLGLTRVMTKNLFAAAHFRVSLAVAGMVVLLALSAGPFAALLFPVTRMPALVTVAAILAAYRLTGRQSGLSAWNGLLAPVAAVLFAYALLRSATVTLAQDGIVWRGTFYPLAELRRGSSRLW